MAISKALIWTALVMNLFIAFCGTMAEEQFSRFTRAAVTSSEESSTLLTRISYSDLFDLFGNMDIAGSERADVEKDLVEILEQNHHKIGPLLRKIEEAFGTNNNGTLGFLEVTGLPFGIVSIRQVLFPIANELANLPSEELAKLERPETGYSMGWSHGKESFRVMDNNENDTSVAKRRYDTAKGSFYMNPYAKECIQDLYPPGQQPFLEDYLLKMTKFMFKVGLWIAILCDLYLNAATNSHSYSLEQESPSARNGERIGDADLDFAASIATNQWMVYKSLKYGKEAAKARLLYYFPQEQQQQNEEEAPESQISEDDVFDNWCGWHTDHGTLTALLPGQWGFDYEEYLKEQPLDDDRKPGLYIKTKMAIDNDNETAQASTKDRLVHIDLAKDSLGFQLGETLQIMSRGKFVATPHAVKAPPISTSRQSLALFLQPLANQTLPPLKIESNSCETFSLHNRWRSTFGEFQKVTIESFS